MKDLIHKILREEQNRLDEGIKQVVIGLATILSLGLSKSQAQQISDNQPKLSLIKTLDDYNKNPKGLDSLKVDLAAKLGSKTDPFIERFLDLRQDGTIVVKPAFVDKLKITYAPVDKMVSVSYRIDFK